MKPEKSPQKPAHKEKRKTLMGWFFSREEPDKEYLPDLKSQWVSMERTERVKFALGAIFGAVVFIAALIMVYFILAALVGWLGLL